MEWRPSHAIPIVAAVAVVGAGALIGFGQTEPPVAPDQVTVSTASADEAQAVQGEWEATPTTPTSFTVADAIGPEVRLYSSPDVPYADKPVLQNPTWEGLPVVFLVLPDDGEASFGATGGPASDWLHVRVSSRPNNLTAYVRRDEVVLRSVPNHVVIEVGARRVTVRHGDEVLLTETVAVGTDATPTPLGDFFVDGIVDVPYDGGAYGAFQVSVSGFSEVHDSFGGGVGQIAMHGTNQPQLLGQAVSNGCIRMTNDAITRMAELAPLGTPVQIVA